MIACPPSCADDAEAMPSKASEMVANATASFANALKGVLSPCLVVPKADSTIAVDSTLDQ